MNQPGGTSARWLVIVSSACLAGACVALPLRAHLALLSRPLATINYAFRDIVVHPADMLMWLALALWGLSRWLSRPRTPWDWGPRLLWWPLVGLNVLAIVGMPLAVDPLYAGYQIVRSGLLLACYLMLINHPVPVKTIAWALAASTLLQAVVGVGQAWLGHSIGLSWLGEADLDPSVRGTSIVEAGGQRFLRAYGLTVHPNVLGGILMAYVLALAGHYLAPSTHRRAIWLVTLAAGCGALLVTFSRAAWLGALAGAALMLATLVFARQPDQPAWRRLLALIAVVVAVLVIFGVTNWPLLMPRLGLVRPYTEVRAVDERLMLQQAAWQLVRLRPLTGVGLGNFATALYLLVPAAVSAYPVYQPVHNVILLVAAELGPLGGLLWAWVMVAPLLVLWRERRRRRITPWWAGLTAFLVGLAVVCLLDHYPWSLPEGTLLLTMGGGLWAREWRHGLG